MHYISSGNGSAILLIHGLFGDLDNLKSLARALEHNHQVIRIDCPNHGQSEHWQTMTYPKLSDAIIQLLEQLNINKVHIIGHSMGGKIAMAVALAQPTLVKSLTIADIAPVSYPPKHNHIFTALQSLPLTIKDRRTALEHLIKNDIDESTAQFLLKNLQRTDNGFQWRININGLIESYPEIIGWHNEPTEENNYLTFQGPTLLLRGSESNYVTQQHKHAILSQFPKATVKTINGAGHWLHIQKQAVFNQIIVNFIKQHEN